MRHAVLTVPTLVAIAALGGATSAVPAAAQATAVVASITDGDTLRLTSGMRVRLLQIDAPEVGTGECHSRASRTALLARVSVGSRIVLERDHGLDTVDRYGRLLRYVRRGTMNVNVALVRAGAAAPYFYRGERGTYAGRLLAEATRARAGRRGLWGACPRTALDPTRRAWRRGGAGQVERAEAWSGSSGAAVADAATRRTRASASRHLPPTSTARRFPTGDSAFARPTRMGSTGTATASAASTDHAAGMRHRKVVWHRAASGIAER